MFIQKCMALLILSTTQAPLWRLAGNPAFEQSQQFIFAIG